MKCRNCSREFASVKAWEYHECKPLSSSPSYTLAEWERLGREFSDECQEQEDSVIEGLVLGKFAKWLARKEKETNEQVGQEDVG